MNLFEVAILETSVNAKNERVGVLVDGPTARVAVDAADAVTQALAGATEKAFGNPARLKLLASVPSVYPPAPDPAPATSGLVVLVRPFLGTSYAFETAPAVVEVPAEPVAPAEPAV